MADTVDKVKDERGLFEKVASYIPGYHGYKEKELRRESDRLVRLEAAAYLKEASDMFKRSLSSGTTLPDAKRLSADRVTSRLDLLKERVTKAVGGYSGFFDAVKVRENRLDKMIQADFDLVSLCSALDDKVHQISKRGVLAPTWSQDVAELEGQIDRLEEAFRTRNDVISRV